MSYTTFQGTSAYVSIQPPTGSVMGYLGTTDPPGWVLCNGVARTDNSDGKYNKLNALGIGSGGSGTTSYTPPNYTGRFLVGSSTTGTTNVSGGSNTVTLSTANLPAHAHAYPGPVDYKNSASSSITYTDNVTGLSTNTSNRYGVHIGRQDLFANGDALWSTTDTVGSGTAFSIVPSNYSVNWILKI